MQNSIIIHETDNSNLKVILSVENDAFEGEEEIETLVKDLLVDPSAKPLLSLLAWEGNLPVGHILFTHAELHDMSSPLSISILAPLAVIPSHQKKGIGTLLIQKGLERLKGMGVDLVFVLGHIEYYPRCGFEPAWKWGLEASYPIPEAVKDAWMVQELTPGILGSVKGKIQCAKAMDKPEYWRE